MQLKNDYEREVYNGDVGFITKVTKEDRTVTVRFDDRDVVYQEPDLEELTLAYATTTPPASASTHVAAVSRRRFWPA